MPNLTTFHLFKIHTLQPWAPAQRSLVAAPGWMQPASRGDVSPDHEMPRILRSTQGHTLSDRVHTAPYRTVPYHAFAYHSCLTCSDDCDLGGHLLHGTRIANRDLLFLRQVPRPACDWQTLRGPWGQMLRFWSKSHMDDDNTVTSVDTDRHVGTQAGRQHGQ